MMEMNALRLILLSILTVAVQSKDDCQTGYTLCSPSGATSTNTPQIGSSEFQNLFSNLVSSSLPSVKRAESAGSSSLCCVESLSCLTVANLAIPFCYDKFTTNFFLPDRSFGTVATGSYTSSKGDTANLESGDYTLANGEKGNIYSANPGAKPNTSNLPIPSQFTGTGVGAAIPASALGGEVTVTYTTTLPGTTRAETVVSASTAPGSVLSRTEVLPVTISTSISNSLVVSTASVTTTQVSTASGSTVQATTIPGTTATGIVTTITTTELRASASASASKTAGANNLRGNGFEGLGFAAFVAALAIFY